MGQPVAAAGVGGHLPPLGGVGGLRRLVGGRRLRHRRRDRRPRPAQGLPGGQAGVGGHPHPDRLPRLPGQESAESVERDREAAGHSARAAGEEAGGGGAEVHAGPHPGAGARAGAAGARVHRRTGREEDARGSSRQTGSSQGSRGKLFSLSHEGWCDSPGTLEEVREKLHTRQKGTVKREKVTRYALSHQQSRPAVTGRSKHTAASLKPHGFDRSGGNWNWNWNWLERWMAAKTWESRLMECNVSEAQHKEDDRGICSTCSELCPVNIKKNNISTRISARPPTMPTSHCGGTLGASSPSTGLFNNESSASSSSAYMSTPISSSACLASGRTEDGNRSRPNYMNLTESIKAKQKASNTQKMTVQEHPSGGVQSHRKTSSNTDMKTTDCSNPPSLLCCKLENHLPQKDKSSMRSMGRETHCYRKRHTCDSWITMKFEKIFFSRASTAILWHIKVKWHDRAAAGWQQSQNKDKQIIFPSAGGQVD
ncbi:unnamed protein product, partial [Musa textilis]